MRSVRVLFLAVLTSLIVRLTPYLYSGVPFSTDSWGPIGNALRLLQHTPVPMTSDVFDGYNNFWPANSIFSAVTSLVTGVPLIPASAVAVPVAGGLGVVALAALVKRLTASPQAAYASALMLSLFFNNVMMCGGVIKECYACPIALALMLTPLLSVRWRDPPFWVIALILASGLTLSHHLTLLLTLMILGGWLLLEVFNHVVRGSEVNGRVAFLALALASIGYAYNMLYAWGGLKLSLSEDIITSLTSYYLVFTAAGLYVSVRRPPSKPWIAAAALATLAAPPALTYMVSAGVMQAFMTPSPHIPPSFAVYSISYSVLGALALIGYRVSWKRGSTAYVILWLSALLAFETYALIAEPPMAVDLAYRTLDFLAIPLAVMAALPLREPRLRRAASAGVAVFLAVNALMVYSTLTGVETHLGHFWVYSFRDLELASLINSSASSRLVYGDVRTSFLYQGLYMVKVDYSNALRVLKGGDGLTGALIMYEGMLKEGFVSNSGSLIPLRESVVDALMDGNDLTYSDGWGALVWGK